MTAWRAMPRALLPGMPLRPEDRWRVRQRHRTLSHARFPGDRPCRQISVSAAPSVRQVARSVRRDAGSAIRSNTRSLVFGASPSDGSSSSRSRGRPSNARTIASICCSPPLKHICRRAASCLENRKARKHPVDVGERGGVVGAAIDPHQQVFFDAHAAEDAATFGHQRDAGAKVELGRLGRSLRPS